MFLFTEMGSTGEKDKSITDQGSDFIVIFLSLISVF